MCCVRFHHIMNLLIPIVLYYESQSLGNVGII